MVGTADLVNATLRILCCAALLCATACASSSSTGGRGHAAPQPTSTSGGGVTDASYDWHVLVSVPFSTLLKESPIPLHEVLLFHDETPPAAVENKDCFATDGPAPRFVGRQPHQHLLCFDHDRLNRIEAEVRLPAAEASSMFMRACASWLKNTATVAPAEPVGTVCEGRDGNVAFSAHLALAPGDATATLSMTLSNAAPHDTVRDAIH